MFTTEMMYGVALTFVLVIAVLQAVELVILRQYLRVVERSLGNTDEVLNLAKGYFLITRDRHEEASRVADAVVKVAEAVKSTSDSEVNRTPVLAVEIPVPG